jgi:hypothetical protein
MGVNLRSALTANTSKTLADDLDQATSWRVEVAETSEADIAKMKEKLRRSACL